MFSACFKSTEKQFESFQLCHTLFTAGAAAHPVPLEMQVKLEVKVEDNTDNESQSEDAEG